MIGLVSDKKRAKPAKLTWIRQHPKEYIKRSSFSLDNRIDTHITEGTVNGWMDKLMQNMIREALKNCFLIPKLVAPPP